MESNHGAALYCGKIGLYVGGTTRTLTAEEQKGYNPKVYWKVHPYLIGACKADDIWPDCNVDCNIERRGGCLVKPHDLTKKEYYVCGSYDQSKMFYLFCNGTYNLPLSSCYGKFDIK